MAQRVKNLPAVQETRVQSLVREDPLEKGMATHSIMDLPGGLDSKVSTYNAGDLSLIPGLGRSPGEGTGNPFQYSCLENSLDRGAWCATV